MELLQLLEQVRQPTTFLIQNHMEFLFSHLQEISPIYMLYLLRISLFTVAFSAANELVASDIEKKFRQIERSWIEKYGRSHPSAELEKDV